jgi:hypothetical protein
MNRQLKEDPRSTLCVNFLDHELLLSKKDLSNEGSKLKLFFEPTKGQ